MQTYTFRLDRNNIFLTITFLRRCLKTFSIVLHYTYRDAFVDVPNILPLSLRRHFSRLCFIHFMLSEECITLQKSQNVESGKKYWRNVSVTSQFQPVLDLHFYKLYLLLEVILWRVNTSYQQFYLQRYAFLSILSYLDVSDFDVSLIGYIDSGFTEVQNLVIILHSVFSRIRIKCLNLST